MNIEIANRLVALRKSNGLSQEELAEKLGLSRQAISRWERAEASPDIENLLILSKLYCVSLDELLGNEQPKEESEQPSSESDEASQPEINDDNAPEGNNDDDGVEVADAAESQKSHVKIGRHGIDVHDGNDKVHVGFDGIYVDEGEGGDHVNIGGGRVIVNGTDYTGKKHPYFGKDDWFETFPFFTLAFVIYMSCGVFGFMGGWGSAWLVFLASIVITSLIKAVRRRNAASFAYPVFVTLIFLSLGFYHSLWHPSWLVFLTIPVYYGIVKSLTGKEN